MPTERSTLPRPWTAELTPEGRGVLDAIGAAVLLVDPDGPVVYANPACARLTGRPADDVAGTPWRDLCGEEADAKGLGVLFDAALAGEASRGPLDVAVAGGAHVSTQASVARVAGGERLLALTLVDLSTEQQAVEEAVSAADRAARHLGARRVAEAEIRHLARHDRLTGLPNRAQLERRLKNAVTRAGRRERSVALLSIDLDGFKLVNASFGHKAGDRLLRRIAARLRTVEAERGFLARYGGDEFLVLLADLGDDAEVVAHAAADRVAACLAKPFTVSGSRFLVEASVGISLFPADADGAGTLLRHAQSAMHQGKGRALARRPSTPAGRTTRSSASRSRPGCAGRSPRTSSSSTTSRSCRWPPARCTRWRRCCAGTTPSAASSRPATSSRRPRRWACSSRSATGCSTRWAASCGSGAPRASGRRGSRSTSPRASCTGPTSPSAWAAAWTPTGWIRPGSPMELTESATLRESDQIDPLLRELSALGLELAIDDFGAGWSSLSRLRHMPVGELKIDRSFLSEIPDDQEAGAIVRTVINLAEALGMITVAEGVETAVQRSFLSALECPLAQGRHFSPPMPADQVTERLRAGSA